MCDGGGVEYSCVSVYLCWIGKYVMVVVFLGILAGF